MIDQATKSKDMVDVGLRNAVDAASTFVLGGQVTYAWGDLRGHNNFYGGNPTYLGNTVKGHGPEIGFNRHLAAGGPMAIIKYTGNFSALQSSKSPWLSPGTLWTAWQAFVDARLAEVTSPVVAGVVWFQGIDDGLLARTQAAYEADLRQMIVDLRTKFGATLPFIMSRSINSQIAGSTNMAPIRAGQDVIGAETGNARIDVDDLSPLYVATHHMTAQAQLVSGQRFAYKYAAATDSYLAGAQATLASYRTAINTLLGGYTRSTVIGGQDILPASYSAGAPGWSNPALPAETSAGGSAALRIPDYALFTLGQTVGATTIPSAGTLVQGCRLSSALRTALEI